jgi:hypothetical protein
MRTYCPPGPEPRLTPRRVLRFRATAATAVAFACLILPAACNDDDAPGDSGAAPTSAEKPQSNEGSQGRERCTVAVVDDTSAAAEKRTVPAGERFPAELRKVFQAGPRIDLEVTGAVTTRRIRKQLGDDAEPYVAADGTRFVAVMYRFTNRAARSVEAASTVNAIFTLSTADGRVFRRADDVAGCAAASPNFALTQPGTESPERDAAPGASYQTAVVYIVPTTASELAWTGPATRVPLEMLEGPNGSP